MSKVPLFHDRLHAGRPNLAFSSSPTLTHHPDKLASSSSLALTHHRSDRLASFFSPALTHHRSDKLAETAPLGIGRAGTRVDILNAIREAGRVK